MSNDILNKHQYQTAYNGAIVGFTAGIADVGITTAYNKHQHKNSIKIYKNAPFSDKKLAIKLIQKHELSVRRYKENVKKIMQTPVSIRNMLTRGILYGSILSIVGLLLDLKKKNNAN